MLNSFESVVNKYNSTPPVDGSRTRLEMDVRPIWNRKRKGERIVKINDNCYALSDGIYEWPLVYNHKDPAMTVQDVKQYAPIVWEKHDDGRVTVTVRNHYGASSAVSRYNFLRSWLPSALRFTWDAGKHTVHCNGNDYHLPKGEYDRYTVMPWGASAVKKDNCLMFEQVNWNEFKLISEEYFPKRPMVDNDLKKQYAPAIRKFYDWMVIMAPLLRDTHDVSQHPVNALISEITEHTGQGPNSKVQGGYTGRTDATPEDTYALYREIITDEQHPVRVALTRYLLNQTQYYVPWVQRAGPWRSGSEWHDGKIVPRFSPAITEEEFNAEMKKVRSRINTLINRLCGFTKLVEKKGE